MATKQAGEALFSVPRFCAFVCSVVFVFLTLADNNVALAQDRVSDELRGLPAAEPGAERLYLTKTNVDKFDSALVAPIAEWVKQGRLVLPVVRELKFAWDYATRKPSATPSGCVLTEQGGVINCDLSALAGLPFGDAGELNSEKDLAKRARQILWNSSFVERPAQDVFYSLELTWMSSQAMLRKANGVFYRRYFPKVDDNAPIFREELLRFFTPAVVFGYTEFSRRTLTANEDLVWVYSPVTGRSRQVLQSNRSDALLGSVVTFDDLQVSSENYAFFDATVLEEKILFLPFPSLELSELIVRPLSAKGPATTAPEGTKTDGETALTVADQLQRSDGSSVRVLWNYESNRFPQGAAWLPTTVTFVPRRVWIIDLLPRDPFYLTGREVLVVDQESMLPFYKLVYDRDGSYKKTVMSAWGLASTPDRSLRLPYTAFVLAVEHRSNVATAFTTLSARTFQGKPGAKADELRALMKPENFQRTVAQSSSASSDAGQPEATAGY